jgi:hypothetical protein
MDWLRLGLAVGVTYLITEHMMVFLWLLLAGCFVAIAAIAWDLIGGIND